MERLRPFFPKSHGKPRVDDRRVLSGIVFVNKNGLRWRDAPSAYGPHKTPYNRWKRRGGGRRVHAHDGGVGDRRRGAKNGHDGHDRRDLLEGAPHGIEPAS
jgi:transposase